MKTMLRTAHFLSSPSKVHYTLFANHNEIQKLITHYLRTTMKHQLKRSSHIAYLLAAIEEVSKLHMGSSTETVAFQVYEILKIDHEFLQFF